MSNPDFGGKKANATEQYVQKCSDGSFCCQANDIPLNSTAQVQVNSCCDQKQGIIIKNGEIVAASPSATSASNTVTTSPSTSPTPIPPPPPKSDTAAIAGGVVGGIAALAITAAAIFFLLRRRRTRRSNEQSHLAQEPLRRIDFHAGELDGSSGPVERAGYEMGAKGGAQHILEKDGTPQRFEKDGGQIPGQISGPYEI